MQIKTFVFNPLRTNMYVLSDDSSECVFVDATCESLREQERIEEYVAAHHLKPAGIYNTHGHPDHIAGNAFLCSRFNIPAYLHTGDHYMIERSAAHGASIGLQFEQPPVPQQLGESIHFGNTALQVLHTPGHSKGCAVFYSPQNAAVFTGDTLFAGCIGRTDLQGGDYDEIMRSIHGKLLALPDETEVFAGHGRTTQIGTERRQNPFLV